MFNPLDPKFLVPWLIFEEDERAEAAERARRAAADRYDESGDESGDESDDELEEASNICPECGADLDRQQGFDETEDVWKCKKCGSMLYSPGLNEWELAENICPECGAVLDVQFGFDEMDMEWECEECGSRLRSEHLNVWEIAEEEDEAEYHCPACGEALDDQSGFYNDDTFECRECGTELYYDDEADEYKILENECGECGAVLDKQDGFDSGADEWVCEECGKRLEKGIFNSWYEIEDDE